MIKIYSFLILAIVFASNVIAQNIPSYVPKDGLVGWWPFNGNANDESGNKIQCNANAISYTSDRNSIQNNCVVLEGNNNSYLEIPSNSKLTTNVFSWSYWINIGSFKGNGASIISRTPNGTTCNGFTMITGDNLNGKSGQLGAQNLVCTDKVYNYGNSADVVVGDNKWHHIVFIIKPGSPAIYYVDGKAQTPGPALPTDFSIPFDQPIRIGRSTDGYWEPLFGKIDDLAFFNRVLTQQEITALYTNTPITAIPSYVPKDGLVGYWPFNGNANDESGNGNHGTVNGATLTADRNGKANTAYSFDGLSNFIEVMNSPSLNITQNVTVSFWINKPSLDHRYEACISKEGNYELLNYKFQINEVQNQMTFSTSRGYSGVDFSVNNWVHFVGICTTDSIKIFLNGKLAYNSYNQTNTNLLSTHNNPLLFGKLPYDDPTLAVNRRMYLKAKLDEISIYNRALTQQEITALYTSTPVAQNIPSYVPKDGLVGWWPFNGNANDESGNGNHGTVNGATLTTDRNGNLNKAYSYDGYNNNIKINENKLLNLSSQFSISFWSKIIPKSDNSGHHIIVKGDNSSNEYSIASVGNIMYLNKQNVKSILGANFEQNKWNQVTIVWNYPNAKIYINGVNSSEINTDVQFIPSNTPLYFGTIDGYGGTYGQLDDIAIYNRALSQQEITALYNGSSQSALSSTKVFVDAPATVNQNETLELAISSENLNTSDNVISFQTDFTYDTTRYTYVGNNVVGTLNPNGTVDVNTAKKGLIKLGYMSQTALSGAGSLVKLKFKANDKVGQGIFSLSNFLFNTTNITSLKSDTVNTLDVTPPTAKLTYSVNPARKGDSLLITLNFNEKMAVSPIPQINLTGQNTLANSNLTKVNDSTYTYWWVVEKGNGAVNVNLATGTDLAGNVIVSTPTQNPSFTVLPTVFGDIDTNKLVQAYDAALALQYSVGLNPLPTMDPLPWSNWRLAVANVDTVGSVTANDASLILQHSIGKISSFPADAKKRGGEAPTADVIVKREGNQLVFSTTGTLYAFNGYFKENFNAFGQPEIKDKNSMVATNINANNYNVGLASSTPFTVNEPFLIIPILATTDIAGTIDIVANTQEKALTYSSAAVASINEAMTTTMNVYPNPTKDVVTVTNAQGKTLRIVDFEGRIVSTQAITNNTHEVSLKSIGSKGEYIFQLLGENNETITTQKVVMQ